MLHSVVTSLKEVQHPLKEETKWFWQLTLNKIAAIAETMMSLDHLRSVQCYARERNSCFELLSVLIYVILQV